MSKKTLGKRMETSQLSLSENIKKSRFLKLFGRQFENINYPQNTRKTALISGGCLSNRLSNGILSNSNIMKNTKHPYYHTTM